jgi:hypothetical protein
MDSVSQQRLEGLHPNVAAVASALINELSAKGIQVRIVQGLRTFQEQDALFEQGRSLPGKIVTNARGGYSMHNYGLAIDLVPSVPGATVYTPDWNAFDGSRKLKPNWSAMIHLAESLGFLSGSTWTSLPDLPHLQMTGNFPVSPNAAMINTLRTEGIETIWVQSGLPGFEIQKPDPKPIETEVQNVTKDSVGENSQPVPQDDNVR